MPVKKWASWKPHGTDSMSVKARPHSLGKSGLKCLRNSQDWNKKYVATHRNLCSGEAKLSHNNILSQENSIQISSDTDSWHPSWLEIYLTILSSEGKTRGLQPSCYIKLERDTSEAWKEKVHCSECQTPSCQQHRAAADVDFVNIQLPWEKISCDVFLSSLHYFQNHGVLPCPPKCCISITNHSYCMLCGPDPAIRSRTNLIGFLGTNPILWRHIFVFSSFCHQEEWYITNYLQIMQTLGY